MDSCEDNAHIDSGSVVMGAIFMSNRSTMKECLKRKIFGLPSNLKQFVEKVKVGTILFLFEYEERKLYGVFEAKGNGSLNILPRAFSSSGKSFSAQVRFKRLWYCSPLHENEFAGAIKQNYYAPRKFRFELSGQQVAALLFLFNGRRKIPPQVSGSAIQSTVASSEGRGPGQPDTRVVKRSLSFHKKHITKDDLRHRLLNHSSNKKQNRNCKETHSDGHGIRQEACQTIPSADGAENYGFISVKPEDDNNLKDSLYHNKSINLQCGDSSATVDADLPTKDFVTSTVETSEYPSESCLSQSDMDQTSLSSADYLPLGAPGSPESDTDLYCPVPRHSCSCLSLPDYEIFKDVLGTTEIKSSCNPSCDSDVPSSFPSPVGLQKPVVLEPGIPVPIDSGMQEKFEDNSRGLRYWSTPRPSVTKAEFVCENMVSSPIEEGQLEERCDNLACDYISEIGSYHQRHDSECYSMKSDTYDKRTSVFSRLSKMVGDQGAISRLSRTASDQRAESALPAVNAGASLDDLLDRLSYRMSTEKCYWTEIRELRQLKAECQTRAPAYIQPAQSQGPVNFQPIQSPAQVQLALSQISISNDEAPDCSDIEGSLNLTFINFKRRSNLLGVASEEQTDIPGGKAVECAEKLKKRKLIRPSFGSNASEKDSVECQN